MEVIKHYYLKTTDLINLIQSFLLIIDHHLPLHRDRNHFRHHHRLLSIFVTPLTRTCHLLKSNWSISNGNISLSNPAIYEMTIILTLRPYASPYTFSNSSPISYVINGGVCLLCPGVRTQTFTKTGIWLAEINNCWLETMKSWTSEWSCSKGRNGSVGEVMPWPQKFESNYNNSQSNTSAHMPPKHRVILKNWTKGKLKRLNSWQIE